MVLFNNYIIMYQTWLHVLHKHRWLFMQHENTEFKYILIKTCDAFTVMLLTLHRLVHFSRLLLKCAKCTHTGSLNHMTNIGWPQAFLSQNR